MKKRTLKITLSLFVAFSVFAPSLALNVIAGELEVSKGETVYVSIYSYILSDSGKQQIPYEMSTNLSIRNTDFNNEITILKADYYDSNGNLIKHSLEKPIVLKPMASTYLYIAQIDKSGDWGSNYIVKWQSEAEVNQPIIESLTTGSRGTQALSFVFQGKVIQE